MTTLPLRSQASFSNANCQLQDFFESFMPEQPRFGFCSGFMCKPTQSNQFFRRCFFVVSLGGPLPNFLPTCSRATVSVLLRCRRRDQSALFSFRDWGRTSFRRLGKKPKWWLSLVRESVPKKYLQFWFRDYSTVICPGTAYPPKKRKCTFKALLER